MTKMLLCPGVAEERWQRIVDAAGEMAVVQADDAERALAEIVDADAFYGKLTPELLAAAKKLRWVQTPTASLEHYLFPGLIAHPCLLTNMRGLFSDVIADHVMGMMLCFVRNLHLYRLQQMQAIWEPIGGEAHRGNNVSGPAQVTAIDRAHRHLGDLTLGIVGVGAIGSEIARRASAFGMDVLGIDPRLADVHDTDIELWPPNRLRELLERSDFVVIAAPHTPQTEKMFRREQFEWMKAEAILINVGRGVIVDLADLTAALQQKLIGGAGLDVLETEPLPADHPLWRMENVIITPHVAAASPRIAERHLETLLTNIHRFVAGEELLNPVIKASWF